MPVLVLTVAEDLDKLFEDGGLTPTAALGELGGVVVVAVNVAIVLVIAILGAEHGRAQGAGKVVNVILTLEGRDVGSPQRAAALMAQQLEAAEVVGLAKRILSRAVLVVGREELGSYYLSTVLQSGQQRAHTATPSRKLTRHLKQSK
jgi:hypothetical protein